MYNGPNLHTLIYIDNSARSELFQKTNGERNSFLFYIISLELFKNQPISNGRNHTLRTIVVVDRLSLKIVNRFNDSVTWILNNRESKV